MRIERAEVFNFEGAFRGLRNPMDSWKKSDSFIEPEGFIIGEADMNLALRLIKGGTEHRKFLRQIFVSVDITAPIYWWKEFDTYKVGTVANSTSTMHKIMAYPITYDMFEMDDFLPSSSNYSIWNIIIGRLNSLRDSYMDHVAKENTEDAKLVWKEMVRLLPSAWLQTRTVTMSYENLVSMYGHRRHHKLTEWHQFCDWIDTLPYIQFFIEAATPKKKVAKGNLPKDLHITQSDLDTGLTDDRSIKLEGGSGMHQVSIFMHGSNVSANAEAILNTANE